MEIGPSCNRKLAHTAIDAGYCENYYRSRKKKKQQEGERRQIERRQLLIECECFLLGRDEKVQDMFRKQQMITHALIIKLIIKLKN